jgi:hypothetical protein
MQSPECIHLTLRVRLIRVTLRKQTPDLTRTTKSINEAESVQLVVWVVICSLLALPSA